MPGRLASDHNDPFARLIAPPPNETLAEKSIREKKEADALRVSNAIDDEIKEAKAAMKRNKNTVKVLLLGQSESGKSTTLKNFRMKYAQDEWIREKMAWRAVIQLNLIRSIITIVETLQAEADSEYTGDMEESGLSAALTDQHRLLKLRLGPLRRVETDLKRRLGAGVNEIVQGASSESTQEISLGFRMWSDIVNQADPQALCYDTTEVIAGCRDDMKAIWADHAVRVILKKHRVNLENSAGFFLDDLDRIATRGYEPTDDDVVRARLRTLGIQEHRIRFDTALANEYDREWVIYDVGGSRTVRRAWLPYFEGVNAIIFLAPISCFDEQLLEDDSVNRVEDSLLLWRAIISSKLLVSTTMIVFLNKCDLLKKKIKSGIQIRKYLPSYGERPNDPSTAVKFFKECFKEIARTRSIQPRTTYLYATSVTDTKATATTLMTVRDGILREHLKHADLV
ncbi:guanine nucleotide binding protein, alpha subunit [Mycena floridula]|nr:guanine nucleotide binding protein, alpha subunit [Mycena floridula]